MPHHGLADLRGYYETASEGALRLRTHFGADATWALASTSDLGARRRARATS